MDSSGRELFTCLFFMFTDYPSQCATIGYGQLWERVVYLFVFYVYRLPLTVCYDRLWTALGESCLLVYCLCLQTTPHSVLQ